MICNAQDVASAENSAEMITIRKLYKVTYEREQYHRLSIQFVRDLSHKEEVHDKTITIPVQDDRPYFYRFCDHPVKDRIMVDVETVNDLEGCKMVEIHRNKLIYVKIVQEGKTEITQISRNIVVIRTDPCIHYSCADDENPLWFLYRGRRKISVFNIDKFDYKDQMPNSMRSFQIGISEKIAEKNFCFLAVEPRHKQCDCQGMKAKRQQRDRTLEKYSSKFLNNFCIRRVLGEGGCARQSAREPAMQ
ncbi:hypothetical protein PMAYCL1PPCAC_09529 [Pristionchus mayeri]|uniref:Uncharacterized protein n=1 Tax=Pristionchus mayeri TaxID=1317129 RepID=A0AAN5CE16_9BILA|nr:hypothetical protein PMAYCL1PPCAC_09529 [Pristionchus mayeri]